ncbi:hypothetical protein OIU76_016145 [Salix suchowensis]|uniref:J domain-containing protein n=1 Tax=Salix suchowensis TaxID=1278906 RepID=A0ABQ9AX42_9ROSI|nr:hypothetical protein OIU77_004640 [Salix suchowensis]KAJ6379447.1 hypothetical protein OIU76_016145 [Salix suchowensis]
MQNKEAQRSPKEHHQGLIQEFIGTTMMKGGLEEGVLIQSRQSKQKMSRKDMLGKKFADLLNDSSDSHYQFLGVSADADMEEIKTAYRRLSKEYHPDTTSLPLKAASDKFMRLREVYDILSNDEKRRFYDWTLAQEAASRQAEKMRMRLEDPYEQETKQI